MQWRIPHLFRTPFPKRVERGKKATRSLFVPPAAPGGRGGSGWKEGFAFQIGCLPRPPRETGQRVRASPMLRRVLLSHGWKQPIEKDGPSDKKCDYHQMRNQVAVSALSP